MKTNIVINKKRRSIITKEFKQLKSIITNSDKWKLNVEKYIKNNTLDFTKLIDLYNEGKEFPLSVVDTVYL